MHKKLIKELLLNRKKNIKNCNILCMGDIILDHYIYGRVDRISPEAPIPILLFEKENYQLGGVGNVARNLSSLGAKCSLVSFSNNDNFSKIINKLILNEKKIKHIKIKLNNYKTPIKTRYLNNLSHLIRVDKENTNIKISNTVKKNLSITLNKKIKETDLIILSDYSKGFFDKNLIKNIVKIAKKYNKKIIVDPKNNDFSTYAGIDIITPNQKELNDAAGKILKNEREIILFSRSIIAKHKIKEILITRSEKGMLLVGPDYAKKYKANAKNVFDVTGAGDTVVSILALMTALGMNTETSSQISNHAAGLIIGKLGTAALNFKELITE